MSFYIKPPTGSISLNKVQIFARRRLNFLLDILSSKGDRVKLMELVNDVLIVSNSECLIGGSQKDDVSHFLLRLILSKEEDTSRFLLETESLLFKFRCSCMTQEELYQLLRSLNKLRINANRTEETFCILKSLMQIKKQCHNSWKSVAFNFFNSSEDENFQVPFQTVLSLIAKRQVILKNGVAFVPFSKLLDYLNESFTGLLKFGIHQARCQMYTDNRIDQISTIILNIYRNKMLKRKCYDSLMCFSISHDEIDFESELFPPCMLHLYTILKQRHRLNHHARIQFTLYLKEMGVPVHESLLFWRNEYCKPASLDTDWGHSWKTKGDSYTYSIRHLYGLEGSRKNYRGHCCYSIQNQIVRPTDVGGCPFVHFDRENFQNFLQSQNIPVSDYKVLQEYIKNRDFNTACSYFLRVKMFVDNKVKLITVPNYYSNIETKINLNSEMHILNNSGIMAKNKEMKAVKKIKYCHGDSSNPGNMLISNVSNSVHKTNCCTATDEDGDDFGCDENCASQRERRDTSFTCVQYGYLPVIEKPIDYCHSYRYRSLKSASDYR